MSGLDAGKRNIVVQPFSPSIIRYSYLQAITPCRADLIIKDSWWIIDPKQRRKTGCDALIFLRGTGGYIPQCTNDDLVKEILKRRRFPWADLRKIPEVFLVKHQTNGWQVPNGLLA
jgi:hypothetical protein